MKYSYIVRIDVPDDNVEEPESATELADHVKQLVERYVRAVARVVDVEVSYLGEVP